MGRGKTSAAINFINRAGQGGRWMFIVPYKTEIKRVMEACGESHFFEPDPEDEIGKLNDIKHLLQQGKNIVSTHALFGRLDSEALELIRGGGYNLVMDEVTQVLDHVEITAHDAKLLEEKLVTINENKRVIWRDASYTGKFEPYKEKVESRRVYRYSPQLWLSMIPLDLFAAFKDVYIMTYMFEHQLQRCYFDFVGLPYEYLHVGGDSQENYIFTETNRANTRTNYKELIHICNDRKMNEEGSDKFALSKGWYVSNYNSRELEVLKNHIYNFFRHKAKTRAALNMWTTFGKSDARGMDWRQKLAGKGYSKGFISCNARGTNDFRGKTSLAYLVNRFPHTCDRNFLMSQGIPIDSDFFALSEMLQWIWRSAIRDGKEIAIYVPSLRMRTLLEDWVERVSG